MDVILGLRKRTLEEVLKGMKRPVASRRALCPALTLTNGIERRLPVRWGVERFPIHYRYLRAIRPQRVFHDQTYQMEKILKPHEWSLSRVALRTVYSIPEATPFI